MVSRYHSYLNAALAIIRQYEGKEPLASFLKRFFGQNKKYGSTDRKQIAHLCYCYFRMGKMAVKLPAQDRILAGLFLCSDSANELLEHLKPEWKEQIGLKIEEKYLLLNGVDQSVAFSSAGLLPFEDELSEGIVFKKFAESFFVQPDLFLRVRPGYRENVLGKLQDAGIVFQMVNDDCLALSNSTKVESYLDINKEVVIQDYSSQRVGEFFPVRVDERPYRSGQRSDRVWDCCAASGGKSILVHDIWRNVELTVSDMRKAVLANLKKRFAEAGIRKYNAFVADLTGNLLLTADDFDLIIADVPCSGSGTWARTPEQLYYFQPAEMEKYSSIQKKITCSVIKALKPGGYFLYITCSVFRRENEEVVDFLIHQLDLELIRKDVLCGYDKRADTMFAALLQKPL